eukprot:9967137-Lingulodinium_polyedra.AAC.1
MFSAVPPAGPAESAGPGGVTPLAPADPADSAGQPATAALRGGPSPSPTVPVGSISFSEFRGLFQRGRLGAAGAL